MMSFDNAFTLGLCALIAGAMFVLMVQGIIRSLRGPLCSCGHAAAFHTTTCTVQDCRCFKWTDPNRTNVE